MAALFWDLVSYFSNILSFFNAAPFSGCQTQAGPCSDCTWSFPGLPPILHIPLLQRFDWDPAVTLCLVESWSCRPRQAAICLQNTSDIDRGSSQAPRLHRFSSGPQPNLTWGCVSYSQKPWRALCPAGITPFAGIRPRSYKMPSRATSVLWPLLTEHTNKPDCSPITSIKVISTPIWDHCWTGPALKLIRNWHSLDKITHNRAERSGWLVITWSPLSATERQRDLKSDSEQCWTTDGVISIIIKYY